MLRVENLVVRYGDIQVIHGISLEVGEGESVAMIGANGAGKTTLLRTIMGLHRSFEGSITLDGMRLAYLPGTVATGHRHGAGVFPDLTGELDDRRLLNPTRGR